MIQNIKEMDRIIADAAGDHESVIVFGAGRLCRDFLQHTGLRVQTQIYDNDPAKWGSRIGESYLVEAPKELKKIAGKGIMVVIASGHDREIAGQLEETGFTHWISIPYLIHRLSVENSLKEIRIQACMIEASSLCNAACGFCIHPVMKRRKMNMTPESFEQALYRLKEAGQTPETFWLHCLGEPLLDPDLFRKIRRLKEEFPDSSVGFASNFAAASPKIIDQILGSGQDFIAVSLNAVTKEEYRSIMGLDYEKTAALVKLLLRERDKMKSELAVSMSIVENAGNHEKISAFKELWTNEGAEVRVLQEGKWIGSDVCTNVPPEDTGYAGKVVSRYVCRQLYQELCILSSGDYALCCFDGEKRLELGNVWDTGIYDMFHLDQRLELILGIMHGNNEFDICAECSFSRSQ